jgi:hypothetical protein
VHHASGAYRGDGKTDQGCSDHRRPSTDAQRPPPVPSA